MIRREKHYDETERWRGRRGVDHCEDPGRAIRRTRPLAASTFTSLSGKEVFFLLTDCAAPVATNESGGNQSFVSSSDQPDLSLSLIIESGRISI
jgi:hypothetical protein